MFTKHALSSSKRFLQDDDAPAIPEDFYYDLDEHVSKAVVTEDSGIPSDLLTLQ